MVSPRPRCLPCAVVADRDADPLVADLRDGWAVAGRQDTPPGPRGEAVEGAPLKEAQDLFVLQRCLDREERQRGLERASLARLLALVLLAKCAPRPARLGFKEKSWKSGPQIGMPERSLTHKRIGPPGASRCARSGPCGAAASYGAVSMGRSDDPSMVSTFLTVPFSNDRGLFYHPHTPGRIPQRRPAVGTQFPYLYALHYIGAYDLSLHPLRFCATLTRRAQAIHRIPQTGRCGRTAGVLSTTWPRSRTRAPRFKR